MPSALRSRVRRLEKRLGNGFWFIYAEYRSGEPPEDTLRRTAEEQGVDPDKVAAGFLISVDPLHLETVCLNGYQGPLEDLRGYVAYEDLLRMGLAAGW